MLSSALGNFALPFAVFATAPLLARVFGVSGRGELAAATAPLLLMSTVATCGIPEAVTYFVARSPASLDSALRRAVWLLVGAGTCAAILTIGLSGLLSGGNHTVRLLIVISSLTIPVAVVIGAFRGAASGLHDWRRVNREKYIGSALRVLGIVGLFGLGRLTVVGATVVIASSTVLAGGAYIGVTRTMPRDGAAPHGERVTTRQLLGYGTRVWMGSLSGVLLTRLDQTLMTPLAGTRELGLYAASVNVSDASLLVNNAVRDVTFAADAADRSSERLTRSARISFFASLVIGFALVCSLPLWFTILFGGSFQRAEASTAILIGASVAGVPGSVAGAGLSSRGKPVLRSYSLVLGAVVNFALILLLVPTHGALGAALATLGGIVVASNMNILFARKVCDVDLTSFYAISRSDMRVISRFVREMSGRAFAKEEP